MKVAISDFQSLGDAVIEAKGLTVVVGRSNLGKSALVRAIEGALFNKTGEGFVREGRTRTEVTLTGLPTADGRTTDVHWAKGHNVNEYTIDDVRYAKVGVSAPEAIAAAGYRDVWIGDKDRNKGQWLRPQVQHQHDPIFLLTQSGAFISDVMSAVSRLAALQVASGKCASDLKKQKQLLGVRKGDLDVARRRLAALQPIAALHERVEALGVTLKDLVAVQGVVVEARGLLQQRIRLRVVLAQELPAATEVPADFGGRIVEARRLVSSRTLLSRLNTIELPATVVSQADDLIVAVQRSATAAPLVRIRPPLVRLAGQTLPKAKPYGAALDKIEGVVRTAATVGALSQERERASGAYFSAITASRATKQDAEQAQLELNGVIASLKVCPVCERPMAG